MGINRAGHTKRAKTGRKRRTNRKNRKYELGRQPANTKLGDTKIKQVRCRGGAIKQRALRLESGNFSWGSKGFTHKTRILDVVYNASNNELVRTKTLVKNAIVLIDAAPFKAWYEQTFGKPVKDAAVFEDVKEPQVKQNKLFTVNSADPYLEKNLKDQIVGGRVMACLTTRPGQNGRADGYILEGEELAFYQKKTQKKRK
eukprot:gb/GECH01011261.1/.p1 GENE.gb/GECH01011261.1/~~gb/GECH01011261.1/.p1  ORF type:complete len:200 (+),score=34.76 gb/GECH01011261.1/:1-600(+)